MKEPSSHHPDRARSPLAPDSARGAGEDLADQPTATVRSESGHKTPGTDPLRTMGRGHVGRYEVIYPIGHGGMGSVYAGRLSGLGGFEKLVAVKVIHPHLAMEPQSVDMFLDEARLAAQIHHANVAQIYEVGEDDGLYFMVGELVMGLDLGQLLVRAQEAGRPLSPAMCATIAAQVCRGLQAAHALKTLDGQALNLVHRDVSMSNILIAQDGTVKLIDFGVAWAKQRLADTQNRGFKGKLEYGSPEQWNQEPLDLRTDIYSLGVVLYKAVTRRHPVEALSTPKRIILLLEGRILPPAEALPDIDPALEKILLTALSHDREARYPTAEAMEEALTGFVKKTGEDTSPTALSHLIQELCPDLLEAHQSRLKRYRHEQRPGSHSGSTKKPALRPAPWLGALLGAILLTLLFIAVWLLTRPPLPAPTAAPGAGPGPSPAVFAPTATRPDAPVPVPEKAPAQTAPAPRKAPKPPAAALPRPARKQPDARPVEPPEKAEPKPPRPLKLEDNPYE